MFLKKKMKETIKKKLFNKCNICFSSYTHHKVGNEDYEKVYMPTVTEC